MRQEQFRDGHKPLLEPSSEEASEEIQCDPGEDDETEETDEDESCLASGERFPVEEFV